ncbi:MAG TPA: HAMP domain-containing sensor histidine kinase [Vicinamibacterales bacterium]|nr:HAMP domain-containing sensor histidine kinase [Vicinamibacterales bacterium]
MSEAQQKQPIRRGIGPSALGQLARDRGLRFAAGLAVAVAIPVAVLFYFQFRSLNDLQRASAVVLRQLSSSTANELTKSVQQDLKLPHLEVLLRIGQSDTEPLNLPVIEPMFREGLRKNPFVDAFYVWSDKDPRYAGKVLALERDQPVRPGPNGLLPTGPVQATLKVGVPEGRFLLAEMRDLARYKRAILLYEAVIDGRPTRLEFQLRFDNAARDRLTSFVGFRVDAERLRDIYFPALVREQLQSLQVPTGFPPLVVTLLDGKGQVVFNSSDHVPGRFIDERTFPLVFFDKDLLEALRPYEPQVDTWRIRTGYGDRTIAEIAAARTGPQVALMAVLAAVMAIGVFFVARAAAREVRLAELKSNFVSSVSHDLKTPLALIQLFAETLELGRLKNTDRAQEYYRIINSEARKLTRLINNILDFSKTEAGLRRYKMELLDLSEVTRHVLASLESQFQQNQFTVTAHLPEGLTPVLGDTEAIEQALENLLSNAMKYSPEHREVEVESGQSGRYSYVSVRDRGIGIPPRLRRRIFRKFYRIETDEGCGPQGCGLGLAIVDHVMRAHDGFVQVDSEPGRGSTFSLHFPMHAEADVDEADSGDRRRTADVARSA